VQEAGIEPDIAVPQLTDSNYKDRPRLREADLQRHLINEVKVDDKLIEADDKTDPRFAETPESLKKKGITDFQMYYALNLLSRLNPQATLALAQSVVPAPVAKAEAAAPAATPPVAPPTASPAPPPPAPTPPK
jgi:carboxyl-terminal processing protease